MTMHYSSAEEAYVAAQLQARRQAERQLQSQRLAPLAVDHSAADDVPSMDEAERIWKLLVDSASA